MFFVVAAVSVFSFNLLTGRYPFFKKLPTSPAVDIELYEMLQRDLESLRNALQMKEVIITEKDANVEVP